MKKLCLTSIVAIAMCAPAFAANDIASNASSAQCTESVLDTTSGTSNLEAKWTANTLNLAWYVDDEEYTPANESASTCTYDSGITIPSNEPEKTGYTFNGWSIRRAAAAPQQSAFDLTTLAAYVEEDATVRYARGSGSGPQCTVTPGGGNTYTCDDVARLTGLQENEWLAVFSYGKVKGTTACGSANWNTIQIGATTDTINTSGNLFCWCKVTGFAEQNSDTYSPVLSTPWVVTATLEMGGTDMCDRQCAHYCARFGNKVAARRAIYGQP